MNRKKIILMICAAAVILVAAAALIWNFSQKDKPAQDNGQKSITLSVVYPDNSSKDYPITTAESSLAAAMYQEGLLRKDEYESGSGMYTYVDGVTTNYARDASWWCVTKEGVFCEKGIDSLQISDGDHYKIIYTVG